jgi:hypothetical protein
VVWTRESMMKKKQRAGELIVAKPKRGKETSLTKIVPAGMEKHLGVHKSSHLSSPACDWPRREAHPVSSWRKHEFRGAMLRHTRQILLLKPSHRPTTRTATAPQPNPTASSLCLSSPRPPWQAVREPHELHRLPPGPPPVGKLLSSLNPGHLP